MPMTCLPWPGDVGSSRRRSPFLHLSCASPFSRPSANLRRITDLIREKENERENQAEQERITRNAEALRHITKENERVLVLSGSHLQGLYYGLSGTTAAINPSLMELYLKTDYDRLCSFVAENRTATIAFDAETFDFRQDLPLILSSSYAMRPSTYEAGHLFLLTRKKESAKSEFLFAPAENALVHERFDRDFTRKLQFAQGQSGPLALGNRFSIQAVFRPLKLTPSTFTTWQTVFSNRRDSAGFSLAEKNDDPARYIFSIGGIQIDCPVDVDKWNFYAFEVNNPIVRIFRNGKFFGRLDIHAPVAGSALQPYVASDLPLFIGNANRQGGFFWGDIGEFEIANSMLDENQVAASWGKLQSRL